MYRVGRLSSFFFFIELLQWIVFSKRAPKTLPTSGRHYSHSRKARGSASGVFELLDTDCSDQRPSPGNDDGVVRAGASYIHRLTQARTTPSLRHHHFQHAATTWRLSLLFNTLLSSTSYLPCLLSMKYANEGRKQFHNLSAN
jgi:hypothetical protein